MNYLLVFKTKMKYLTQFCKHFTPTTLVGKSHIWNKIIFVGMGDSMHDFKWFRSLKGTFTTRTQNPLIKSDCTHCLQIDIMYTYINKIKIRNNTMSAIQIHMNWNIFWLFHYFKILSSWNDACLYTSLFVPYILTFFEIDYFFVFVGQLVLGFYLSKQNCLAVTVYKHI